MFKVGDNVTYKSEILGGLDPTVRRWIATYGKDTIFTVAVVSGDDLILTVPYEDKQSGLTAAFKYALNENFKPYSRRSVG